MPNHVEQHIQFEIREGNRTETEIERIIDRTQNKYSETVLAMEREPNLSKYNMPESARLEKKQNWKQLTRTHLKRNISE